MIGYFYGGNIGASLFCIIEIRRLRQKGYANSNIGTSLLILFLCVIQIIYLTMWYNFKTSKCVSHSVDVTDSSFSGIGYLGMKLLVILLCKCFMQIICRFNKVGKQKLWCIKLDMYIE